MSGMKIIAGVVVLAGVAVAGQWYTKEAYKDAVEQQIAQTRANPALQGMTISRDIRQSDFMSFSDNVTVTMTPEFFSRSGIPDIEEGMTFEIASACNVFPFYIDCDSELSADIPNLPEHVRSTFSEINYSFSTTLNAITRNMHSRLSTEAFDFGEEGEHVEFAPVTIETSAGLDLKDITMMFSLPSVTVNAGKETEASIDAIEMDGDLTIVDNAFYVGKMHFSVAGYSMNNPAQGKVEGKNLTFQSDSREAQNGYEVQYRFHHDAVETGGVMPMDLQDVNLDMTLSGISKEAMAYLSGYSQSVTTPQELDKFLSALSAQPLSLHLADVSLKQNGAQAKVNGEATIGTFTMQDVQQGMFLQKVDAQLNVLFGQTFPQAVPALAPLIQQYVQMQILKENEKGDFVTELSLKSGQLSANGTPLNQF